MPRERVRGNFLRANSASVDCIYRPWSKASDGFSIRLAAGEGGVSHGLITAGLQSPALEKWESSQGRV